MAFKITRVYKNSPAYKAGFAVGDTITHLGGEILKDNIDFIYFSAESTVEYTLLKKNGSAHSGVIHKHEEEELGIEFEGDGYGKQRSCCNNCIFCFVDQLPEGLRDTLYFKDDDWRMSFIMGNYVTLSNVSEKEFDRILSRKVSPLYISVHATDPDIRRQMIRCNKFYDILPRLKKLAENGQRFNCQAVLCPGINDGDILNKSISDLYDLYPNCSSFAVVPVGLTKHREGLYPLHPYTPSEASSVISIVEKWQEKALLEKGTRFVFASDEFYFRAGLELPKYRSYEDFEQLEDGVGLVAMFKHDALNCLDASEKCCRNHVSIACGTDIANTMVYICDKIRDKFPITIDVYPIVNDFFGNTVTVSGLITGKDLINQLKNKPLGELLLISDSLLRDRQNVFLDDITIGEICGILNVDMYAISDGYEFIDTILGV